MPISQKNSAGWDQNPNSSFCKSRPHDFISHTEQPLASSFAYQTEVSSTLAEGHRNGNLTVFSSVTTAASSQKNLMNVGKAGKSMG